MPKIVCLHPHIFNKYKLKEIWGLAQVIIYSSLNHIDKGRTNPQAYKNLRGKKNKVLIHVKPINLENTTPTKWSQS